MGACLAAATATLAAIDAVGWLYLLVFTALGLSIFASVLAVLSWRAINRKAEDMATEALTITAEATGDG
jgi:hypothetical protein